MMEPRWDYGEDGHGWQDSVLFLGGTSAFDIYVDYEGTLRLTCGPACNDNWHWAERGVGGDLQPVAFSDPSDKWRRLFYEDRKNMEAYLKLFVPDWQERGLALMGIRK